MYLNLTGEINDDMVNALIDSYKEPNLDKLTIYLSSTGGYNTAACVMMDLINKHAKVTEIVATGDLFSNAFFLVIRCCDVPIRYTGSFLGVLVHQSAITANTRDLKSKRSGDYLVADQIEILNKEYEGILSKVISPTELRLFKEGEDVMFMGEAGKRLIEKCRTVIKKNIHDIKSLQVENKIDTNKAAARRTRKGNSL